MKYALVILACIAAIALYMLALASANSALFAAYYTELLLLNAAIVATLAGLVGYQLWRLRKQLKAGVFGSKLTLRLVLMFALVALLPGALVYTVSFQFLTRSIDTWFDVRVDKALDRGLNLGRTALDNIQQDQIQAAESTARQLAEKSGAGMLSELYRLHDQLNVDQLAIFTSRGSVLAFAGVKEPASPGAAVIQHIRTETQASIDPDGKGLRVNVWVPIPNTRLGMEPRILLFSQPVPQQLAQDAELLERIRGEYKTLSVGRQSLQGLYTVTLTLTLLLALLASLALAFFLSARLSAPLIVLAAGTRAVAQGDFSQVQPIQTRDELGVLTLQFNRMTRQLSDARDSVETQQEALAAANEYLESVLSSLTAGVLAFDGSLMLESSNASAETILGMPLVPLLGVRLGDWMHSQPELAHFADQVSGQIASAGAGTWQAQFEHRVAGSARVLLVRGTRLPRAEHGYVLVFDDISELLQVQRHAAWGEVARRLAHEIKNPLTPIQLSAERLQHKLADKLVGADVDMLTRSTQTIVNQVAALKNMVDDFKEYARAPQQVLKPLDLNALAKEVLTLYEATGWVQSRLPAEAVWVAGDTTRLRQVLHNLLQNAQDAVANQTLPVIEVVLTQEGGRVSLHIMDNGGGFPLDLLARICEPYVTTKTKGTGLGLAIVKKITEEHGGEIAITNRLQYNADTKENESLGALVAITLPGLELASMNKENT